MLSWLVVGSCSPALATDFIRRFNLLGVLQAPVYTDSADLPQAIRACNDGDTLELRAGTDRPFTLPRDTILDLEHKSITIASTGFTVRVRAIDIERDVLTLDGDITLAPGDRVRFFGEGCVNCADRANFVVHRWNHASRELQIASSTTATAPLDLTDNKLDTRPLFAYFHAVIKPASSTQDYSQLLRFRGHGALTIKNITFSGDAPVAGGDGNRNDNEHAGHYGRLLRCDGQRPSLLLDGVQIIDCTRGRGAAQDASFGLWVQDCSVLRMRNCFTDNTDYHGCRIENVGDTQIEHCVFRNFRQRAMGQEASHPTSRFCVRDCWFYCTPDREGRTGPTKELRACLNFDARALVDEVVFERTVFDLVDVEGQGYSWDFDADASPEIGHQSCPMMKFQSIRKLRMSDCQILHGGNRNTQGEHNPLGPRCSSLKFDRTTAGDYQINGVMNAQFWRTVFSGSLMGSPSMHNAQSIEFHGCDIMRDGHFNSSFALDYMDFPIVLLEGDLTKNPSKTTTINHL
ncbi:MAG: hypothetical protein KDA92_23460, partial [Planctomycetales bacterium]|nr:hypothetical protein [Planctomycetales bacterium]